MQSIGSLRHQILEMLDDVSSAAALMASEEKKEIDGDRVKVKEVVGGVADQLSVDPVTSPMPITLDRESYAFRTDVTANTVPDTSSLLLSQLMSSPRSQIEEEEEEEEERGGAEKAEEAAGTLPLPLPLPLPATYTPSLPQRPSSIIESSEKMSPVISATSNEEVRSLPLPLPQKEDSDALFNTQTITQPLPNTSSEEEKEALSASLVAHLIASTDKEEDLLDYVRRAYSAIRNKYVDEALISNATATSSSLSSLLPPPPRTPERGADPLPRPPTATASDVIPPTSLSAAVVVQEEMKEEGVSKEVTAVEEGDDVDEEGREAFLHLLRKHEGEEVKEEVVYESSGKGVEEVMKEEETRHIPIPPLFQPTTTSEVVEAEEEIKAKSNDVIIPAPEVIEPVATTMTSPAPPDTSFSPRRSDISELDRLRLKAASLIFKLEEANTSSPPPPPPSLPHSETVTSGSSEVRHSGSFPVSEPVPTPFPSTSSTSPENNDVTRHPSLTLEGETRDEVVKSVMTSVSESVTSLGSGRRVKNAIIIDQMRQIRSNIEYDHLQRRIERNQRRVKIGEKIVLLLRQQKLLVPPSTVSSTTSSNNRPQLLSIVNNPVDPPTARPLWSPPRPAVLEESHLSPTPSKEAIKEVEDRGSGRGGGPGVVWNIESEPNDRPKSRTRATRVSLLPKRSTPNDDIIPVVVAPSTPPLASPSKAMQRPQSRPHSVRDVNLSSPPQKHAVAIPDTSTPPLPPSQRSQSAQRSNRRVSSGPTKTLTNHTQVGTRHSYPLTLISPCLLYLTSDSECDQPRLSRRCTPGREAQRGVGITRFLPPR